MSTGGPVHVSSLIVRCRPERLAGLRAEIDAMAGAETPAVDPSGKIIVVIETDREAQAAEALDSIAGLAGVLGASLVYHGIDDEAGEGGLL